MHADRTHNDFTMADVIWVQLDVDELRRMRHEAAFLRARGEDVPALVEFLDATDDV